MENPKPAIDKADEDASWKIKAQNFAVSAGDKLSKGTEVASRKITDNSLYYADKVDEKVTQWVSATKQKPWAKKVMGWFKKQAETGEEE